MLELDVNNFVGILESDKLNIIHENVLTEMVKEYIKVRVDAKPEKELPPEEALKPELWALLDETEKENRRKATFFAALTAAGECDPCPLAHVGSLAN